VDRRTELKPDEKALLQKLQRGTWSLAELTWIDAHLPPDTPTLLVGEIRARLEALRPPATAGSRGYMTTPEIQALGVVQDGSPTRWKATGSVDGIGWLEAWGDSLIDATDALHALAAQRVAERTASKPTNVAMRGDPR
jgi:hypothetical protein